MKMKYFSAFLVIILLSSGCGNEEQIQNNRLDQEVSNIPNLYLRPTPFDKKLKGAVIIASLKGDVSVINLFQSNESEKNNTAAETLKAGEIVLQGSTIVCGKNSEVDLLFTNGTSAKIGPDSKLTISAIWQKDFQESKRKVADINEETSPTRIDLDLNIGDLIVDVKKLKKESSFRVKSPLGVAGIRGTQFRIFSENEKVELSVLKGEVSFWDQNNEENKITNSKKLVMKTDLEPILKPLNQKEKQTIQRRITSVKKSTETYDLSNLADKLGTKATRTQPVEEIKQTLEKIKEQNLKDKKKLNYEITSLKNDLKKEKELTKKYKEAAEIQITVLKNNIEHLEKQKQEIQKIHEAEIEEFMGNYNAKLQSIRREVIRADAAGYKRGIDEMMARGGRVLK